jgi:hypothetical protein
VLASYTGSPERSGLKSRGISAVSIWPRKSQTFCASIARAAWSSSSLFHAAANSWDCVTVGYFSMSANSFSLSTVSSWARMFTCRSPRLLRSTSRVVSRVSRLASWDAYKHVGDLFLLFLQLMLPLYHRLLPISNGNRLLIEVLLRLRCWPHHGP